MSIETSPVTWLHWITIDGATWKLWECGHWHPATDEKDPCRFCYPHGLPPFAWMTATEQDEWRAALSDHEAQRRIIERFRWPPAPANSIGQ